MVIWVCEALEVNNLTELAVGPNSLTDAANNNNFASSGSDRWGSDKKYYHHYKFQ